MMSRALRYAAAAALVILIVLSGMAVSYAETEWHSFRPNEENNCVVDYPTPTENDFVKSTWTRQFGKPASGMMNWGLAPTPPIIVHGDLVVLSGATVQVIDADTGKTLRSGKLSSASDWAGIPATYAEVDGRGVILCPIRRKIQALDYETLETLWTYKCPPRYTDGEIVSEDAEDTQDTVYYSQSLSPIAYSDGIMYTGFFSAYAAVNSYVAIAVKEVAIDGKTYEPGQVIWEYKSGGGFYSNGALVLGNHVIVGTQDGVGNNDVTGVSGGAAATAHVISFDKKTGEIVTDLELEGAGDICSTIVLDKAGSRIYWASCGGYISSARVDADTGELSDVKNKKLYGTSALTVSTPIVYKDRVYLGHTAREAYGYFAAYDKDTLELKFRKEVRGNPKGSPILTTAYEDSTSTGYLYAYLPYYQNPGGMQLARFKADTEDASDVLLKDVITANGYEQYAFTSPIASEDGTLFHKNDSTAMFAVKASDEISVGKASGLKFSVSGNKVTAKWSKVSGANRYRMLYRINDKGSWVSKLVTTNSGSFTVKAGSKVRVRVRGEYVDAANMLDGEYSKDALTYAGKSVIKSLKASKKALTVTYAKHDAATGYKVQYSLKKSMKSAKTVTVKGASKVSKKLSKLKSKKKYYVRVRSYKVMGGKTYLGAFSAVKALKTK